MVGDFKTGLPRRFTPRNDEKYMQKKWQVMPKINSDFITKNPDYDQVVLQLLFNRGIKIKEEIDSFFSDSYEGINDSFLFDQMSEVVDLIIKNIKEKNKITIYGDYDADGVTSTVVMCEILTLFKASVDYYIPDRFEEGIGLNKKAIKNLQKNGTKLIITVDGGIVSKKEVEYGKEIGVNIIITDHHTPREESLPDTLIINPLTPGEKYPFKSLAGVCVAQKLREALIKKSKLNNEMKERLINKSYDLLAVGLIADCMSLIGENRVLLKKGMEELNKTNRVGIIELIKVSKISGKLDSWNVGFQLAPRINAAGRLVHAKEAVKLLLTKDANEVLKMSKIILHKKDHHRILSHKNDRNYSPIEVSLLKLSKDLNIKIFIQFLLVLD
jgi:single-stranded-DNA-specific exonuclease